MPIRCALGEGPLQAAPDSLRAARASDRPLLLSAASAAPRQDSAFPQRAALVLGAEPTGIPQVGPPTTSLWRCTAHGLPRRRRPEAGPTSSSGRVGDRRLKRSGLRRVRRGAAGAHAAARRVRRDSAAGPRPLAERPRLRRVLPLALASTMEFDESQNRTCTLLWTRALCFTRGTHEIYRHIQRRKKDESAPSRAPSPPAPVPLCRSSSCGHAPSSVAGTSKVSGTCRPGDA